MNSYFSASNDDGGCDVFSRGGSAPATPSASPPSPVSGNDAAVLSEEVRVEGESLSFLGGRRSGMDVSMGLDFSVGTFAGVTMRSAYCIDCE